MTDDARVLASYTDDELRETAVLLVGGINFEDEQPADVILDALIERLGPDHVPLVLYTFEPNATLTSVKLDAASARELVQHLTERYGL